MIASGHRGLLALAALALLAGPAGAEERVAFPEALAHRRSSAAEGEISSLLAEAGRAAAGTSSFAAEGPSVGFEAGPRDGAEATAADFAVDLEVPLQAGRGARAALARELEAVAPDARAGARALAAADLAAAFVDAWLAQARVAVHEEDVAVTDEWLDAARRRVEAGADPPYEPVLVAGERDRALGELVAARREVELTWGELTARTDLGDGPRPLTLAGLPAVASAPGGTDRGVAAGIDARRRLALALTQARRASSRSRWALASVLAKEGDENLAHLGVAYRFPLRGERAAIEAEVAAAEAQAVRAAAAEAAVLRGRLASARAALAAPAPALQEAELDQARRALAARVAEGKERPSQVLPLRRQLLEARLAALTAEALRARAAADLFFLTGGVLDAP
jgi:hypothetical protein